MSSPGDRLKNWIDGLGEAWKDRLRGWMASWILKGVDDLIAEKEPEIINLTRETLEKVKATPDIPPEMVNVINKALSTGDFFSTIIGLIMIIPGSLSALLGLGAPIGRDWEYKQELIWRTSRLDPMAVITAWRRDPSKYEHYFQDLREQGWTDERIEALKFVTLFYPGANDLVNWQAKEVFEPAMISKYGLRDELGELRRDDFYKAGMSDEQIDNYWMAHWEHPQLNTIIEMLRRTDFTEDDFRAWFRLVEIPPYWREKLIQVSYEIPTRVDVRRFWDMRTITEARLREIYAQQGYHGQDLDDYVLWTKVYSAMPDLISRWKNGWISLDEVRSTLIGYGMPADRLEEIIQTKIEPESQARTTAEKDLTKTEIYKGVKFGVISWSEGIELLMDLGYSEDEADYILTINVEVLTGSPHNYADFKNITDKWRKSSGMDLDPKRLEIRQAAGVVVSLTRDIQVLQDAIKAEERLLVDQEILPAAATAKRDGLRVKLHRAEAELSSARNRYDLLRAEISHSD